MDISINTNSNPANQQINNQQAGVAAPASDGQKADYNAERVVASKEYAQLDDNIRNLEQKKFDLVKRVAAQYSAGGNSFLSDIRFTIYNNESKSSSNGEFFIRFTDLSSGNIEIKNESELLKLPGLGSTSGEIVSGNV
jgi:hypothetical protein